MTLKQQPAEVGALDYIQASSTDVEAAVAFYRDVLGATVQSVAAPYFAMVRLANVDIGIHKRDERGGGWEPGFRVQDIVAFHAQLVAHGVEVTQEFHDIPGGVKLGFTDHDGNRMAVYQYGIATKDLAAS
jgi:predicted enzyme related to lactoylglutathione lyase